ncbi:hypothetical protein H0H93_008036 [Arthromyces matolae]|nr:hypothetical protein H0H93_008036 [Arthromyces matolae]
MAFNSLPNELLSLVFQLAGNQANSVNARVCHRWYDIVMSVMWRDLDSLPQWKRLIEFFETKDSLGEPGWGRFCFHAKRVQTMTYHFGPPLSSPLRMISQSRPVQDLFPRLHTLSSILNDDTAAWLAVLPFLHDGLRRWNLEFRSYLSPIILIPFLFPKIRLQGLCRIDFTVARNTGQLLGLPNVVRVARDLPNLDTLVVPLYEATRDMLSAASELPVLNRLLSDRYGQPCGCRCRLETGPSFPVHSFPVLESLTISGCAAELSSIIRHPQFPIKIRTLFVDHSECKSQASDPEVELDLTDLHALVAQRCVQLTEYRVFSVVKHPYTLFRHMPPLISLELLDLAIPFASSTQETMQPHLVSLPNLISLHINRPSLRLSKSITPLVLQSLPLIASVCPQLQTLRIYLDLSNSVISTDDIIPIPFKDLRELDVGTSSLSKTENIDTVAAYLGVALPESCKLKFGPFPESKEITGWVMLEQLLHQFRSEISKSPEDLTAIMKEN